MLLFKAPKVDNLKILVTYSTRTNNIKTIAEAIYGEIKFKKKIKNKS
jgi:hypothetical protein